MLKTRLAQNDKLYFMVCFVKVSEITSRHTTPYERHMKP